MSSPRSTGSPPRSAAVGPSALFEHGLSGRLWPLHGKPYPDELLSSWLMRLIRAYGADSHRFCAHVWPGRPAWSRDIDQGRDAAILRVLTAKTATHPTRVLCTPLRGYPGYPKARGPRAGTGVQSCLSASALGPNESPRGDATRLVLSHRR